MDNTEPVPPKKKFSFFGLTARDLVGMTMMIIGFFFILIGVFIIAYNLFAKNSSGNQPPPPAQKKQKKANKKKSDVVETPVDVEKKENEIKQNASNILLDEYNNTKIPKSIIQDSDTEKEQETKDDDLLD